MKNAQDKFPGDKRILYLDIEGHRNKKGGFDTDMLELQKEFLLGFLMEYLHEAKMPFASVENAKEQNNNVPRNLTIQGSAK